MQEKLLPNNKVLIDTTNNYIEFYVQVSSSPVQQLYIADGAIVPVTDSDIDLGTTSLRFKDTYTDTVTTTGNVSVGGNLTVTGTTTFNGGTITMGDAATDNVVFGADVDSNIIPDDDDTYDLGSSSQQWRNLYIDGTAEIDTLAINGTTVTSTAAELNILDGVTSTAAELNILDGVTSTAAELNILDGVTASAADINLIDGITNGTVIASKAIITDANKDITGGRNITISGELDAATLDISGDADIDGTLEADAITIGGITLAETISDTVGAMVSSNTETNITVTYDDSDNTLDFVIGTLNQDTTGTADNITVSANNSTDETVYPIFVDGATGSQGAESDTGLTYNPSSGVLTATQFTGNLTGNVTGNTSGTAATVTGAAQSNITSLGTLTTLTVDNVIINGTTIGHTSDTDLMTLADGVLTVAGEVSMTTLDIGGTNVTSTAAELNILDGVTSTAAELNYLDITTLGTTEASKAVTTDSNGDILLPDSDKIKFGAGSDLQIYHDGSNSYIVDNGTGDLLIRAENNLYLKRTNSDETYFSAAVNGAATLFHNNNAKIATTISGIDVTGVVAATSLDISGDIDVDGTSNLDVVDIDGAVNMASTLQVDGSITSSDGATITVNDNSEALSLVCTDADASEGPIMSFYRNSGSPADNDILAQLYFQGENDADQKVNYGLIKVAIQDASDGTEDVKLSHKTLVAGTERERMTLLGTETVFNEDSVDLDFRVESNGNANMLFVNGGTDKVGIGTASPTTQITASTSANITQVALTSSSNAVAWDATAAANAYHVTTENTTFAAPSNAVEGAIIYCRNLHKVVQLVQ